MQTVVPWVCGHGGWVLSPQRFRQVAHRRSHAGDVRSRLQFAGGIRPGKGRLSGVVVSDRPQRRPQVLATTERDQHFRSRTRRCDVRHTDRRVRFARTERRNLRRGRLHRAPRRTIGPTYPPEIRSRDDHTGHCIRGGHARIDRAKPPGRSIGLHRKMPSGKGDSPVIPIDIRRFCAKRRFLNTGMQR